MNGKEVELFVRLMLSAIGKEVKAYNDLTSKHINNDAYITLAEAQNLRMKALALTARQNFANDTNNN